MLCNTARTPPKYLWVIERYGRRIGPEQLGCILLRTVSFCDAQPVSFPQHLPEKYLWVIERHGRRVRREQPGCILLRTVTLLRPEFQVNGDQVWGYG